MNSSLSYEQRLLIETVRRLIRKERVPLEEEVERWQRAARSDRIFGDTSEIHGGHRQAPGTAWRNGVRPEPPSGLVSPA